MQTLQAAPQRASGHCTQRETSSSYEFDRYNHTRVSHSRRAPNAAFECLVVEPTNYAQIVNILGKWHSEPTTEPCCIWSVHLIKINARSQTQSNHNDSAISRGAATGDLRAVASALGGGRCRAALLNAREAAWSTPLARPTLNCVHMCVERHLIEA